jgi:E3 ubiquitin-protein ligase RFWD2
MQAVLEMEEHEKRVWSVDFSFTDPHNLASGSDDGKVKVWDLNMQRSTLTLDLHANVCCVKYNPASGHHLAVGSADHHVHSYDLRHTARPLCIFSGHSKAVSYVKFMSGNELVSASTDSTLRLWDVRANTLLRTMRGHTNEKNFVGLSVSHEYIACGSETNQVFVYQKQVSKPMCTYYFQTRPGEQEAQEKPQFISAVCWKGNSPIMLAANSQGTIKVLKLAV